MKILIIENDNDLSESLKDLLEYGGNTVYVASNYKSGLTSLSQVKPDLALIDVRLDRIAFELFDYCHDNEIPCIAMSASPKYKNDIRSDYFLAKPFNLDTFENTITELQNKIDKRNNREYSGDKSRDLH